MEAKTLRKLGCGLPEVAYPPFIEALRRLE
jgi:hypothetical protein